jgi:hypothetical protein
VFVVWCEVLVNSEEEKMVVLGKVDVEEPGISDVDEDDVVFVPLVGLEEPEP